EELSYSIPDGYSFYVDDQQAIYKKNDELVYATDGKETSILKEIEGMNVSENGVIAWSRHTAYTISPEGKVKSEIELPQYIKSGTLTEEGLAFLYVQT
ncbi:hypothetical protein R0K20_17125, partial [Staphylococcus sp. SIMBA_130]